MTDRGVKEMIFEHKPHLRFQKVGKYAEATADDEHVGIIVIRTLMLDTWHYLAAWDVREPRPPWADEVLVAARRFLRDTDRYNDPGDDVVVCFAHLQ
jgi:hypothetical protein